MKNKILFVTNCYLPIIGGIEQNIYKITDFLKKDYKIDIITKSLPNEKSEEKINGINVKRMPISEFNNYPYEKYDKIIITNFNLLPHFNIFKKIMKLKKSRKLKAKIILVPHGGLSVIDWSSFSLTNQLIKKSYNNTFGKFFINNYVDRIIAVSDFEKNSLKNYGIKKKIVVIRNGIDPIKIKKIKKENYFVFVGRIAPVKNLEEIVLTFKQIILDNNFKDYKLKIIGDYNKNKKYYNLLKKLITKNNLISKVEFLGEKLGKEKLKIVAKSKCLFCLSKIESDSLVIKEAFSVKTKVLINNKGALKDYKNENNVFIKNENNLNMIKINNFLNKPFNNKLKIKLMTWEEISDEYSKIIRKN